MKIPYRHSLIALLAGALIGVALFVLTHAPAKPPHPGVQVAVTQPSENEASLVPAAPPPDQSAAVVGDEKAQPDAVKPAPAAAPATLHHAPYSGQHPPLIAIIIDDVGLDLKNSARAAQLPAFVTLSYMPYATRLRDQTAEARDQGHELMLHMPMEPLGHDDPGPGALLTGLPPEELRQRLDTALASFTGFDGVNNHMGSKFTADKDDMALVMNELLPRHLFFLDSRTSAQSVGYETAHRMGVPGLNRDVFLDDDMSYKAVMRQLEQTEHIAAHKGYAIAIGHPHPDTLQALETWLPAAQKAGFVFVPVHKLLDPANE